MSEVTQRGGRAILGVPGTLKIPSSISLTLYSVAICLQINRKKRRRVRAVAEDSDEEEQGKNDREAIANQLFDGGEEPEPESAPVKREDKRPRTTVADEELDEEEEFSDTDSFIVGDDGEPIHGHQKRRAKYADANLQEAQEIFGLDFDVADFEEDQDEYDEDGEVCIQDKM